MFSDEPSSERAVKANRCILYADAAGIFVHMSAYEDATIAALLAAQKIFRAEIAAFCGTITDMSGDSVVAHFVDPAQALDCALSLQARLATAEINGMATPLLFRIGLATGATTLIGDSIHGHVVNLAARIQTIAVKGGIAICPNTLAALASHPLCRDAVAITTQINPGEPRIRCYQLFTTSEEHDQALTRYEPTSNGFSRASPNVLVFPFNGLMRMNGVNIAEVATMIAIHELTLAQCQVDVARPPSKTLTAQDTSLPHLGMFYDYVVRGVVTELPEPRLHLLLIEANTGRTLFSETLPLSSTALEQSLERTMTFMRNKLMSHEIHLFHRMKFKAKGAFHYLLLAEERLKHFSRNSIEDAIKNLRTALDFDPDYARVYATLSKTYCIAWRFEWDVGHRKPLDEAMEMSVRAMELDSHDPAVQAAHGFSAFWAKDNTAALASYERALRLNPNDPELCADAAMVYSYKGRYDRAATLIKQSLEIDSSNPDYRLWSLADAYHGMQRYGDAVDALKHMSDRTQANRLLAACAVRLGQDAAPYVARVLHDQPHFSVRRWMAIQPLENPDEAADYADSLIAAGLPN